MRQRAIGKGRELTRETIVDGWVRTGDIYRQDAEGFFYHVGRSDDCFKVRGLWVSPIEVESALVLHHAVAEAAVVVVTDTDGLATAKAYVVIRHQGASEALKQELREFVGSRLPLHKVLVADRVHRGDASHLDRESPEV